jgi:hypothetical protein
MSMSPRADYPTHNGAYARSWRPCTLQDIYVSWQNGCGRCETDDHVPRPVVLLVGLILLLAGCTSDSAPDPASGPLVVIGISPTPARTTTTMTTTTRASIDPTQCSAVDLHGEVEDYPGAYDGPTNPAEATRKAIIEAALSCDFDRQQVERPERKRNGATYPNTCCTTQLDALSMISHRDCTIRPPITAHMGGRPCAISDSSQLRCRTRFSSHGGDMFVYRC